MIINSILAGENIEFEEGSWTQSTDQGSSVWIVRDVIAFSKTHNIPPSFVIIQAVSGTVISTTLTFCILAETSAIFGTTIPSTSSLKYCGFAYARNGGNTASTLNTFKYGRDTEPPDLYSSSYYKCFVNETKACMPTGSDYILKSGVTYKWKAYWL